MAEPETTSTPAPPSPPPPPRYAGFNVRVMAAMLDLMLLMMMVRYLNFLITPLAITLYGAFNVQYDHVAMLNAWPAAPTLMNVAATVWHYGLIYRLFVDGLIATVVFGAIILPFWFFKQATPGKLVMGTRIVDARTLATPSRLQFIVRLLGYIPSFASGSLGFLWVGLNRRKRGWHDLLAGTVVIMERDRWFLKLPQPSIGKVWSIYKDVFRKIRERL